MNPPTLSRRAFNAALVSAAASGPAAWAQAPDSPIQQVADDYYRGIFALFPLEATENAGDPAYEAAFEIEIAPAQRARQRAFYERTLARLQAMDGATFSRDDRITRDLLAWDARDRLALMAVPHHLMPVTHAGGLPVRLAQWAGGEGSQPMKTTLHYEHFLQRLQGMPGWIDQAIVNMQEGMAAGIVLPRALVERTLPQLDGLLPADAQQSPYLAGVRKFPDTVPEADRPRLREAYATLVREQLAPAVIRLRAFMRERYLPAARATPGFGALPGGAGWYEMLVRSFTTTDMTPDEIHALGLREVARIRGEMEKVKERFGFRGDLQAFFRSLDTRKELTPFQDDEQVMAAYRAINARVQAGLPRLFARAPKARLEIRPVDPLQRDTASSYYVPPSIDGSRPGVFFAAFTDAKTARTTQMAALFLHEGQPGHHYQIALQQESATSRFRRGAWWDAHGEGWALYAEGLGGELGLYDDANAWLGRLQMEMLRALRLVVDTGLHAKGWTREQAIAYSRENDGSSEDDARRAIERYMAWPGQATAYKVGELRILALRDKARARLGGRFDIRAFHAQVLGDGCMPLRMLETKVDAWLAAA
jgi:uncharacterized protein (DUF885 family)